MSDDRTRRQIAELEDAIAEGVLTVRTGERLTTYRGLGEMMETLRMLKTREDREAGRRRRNFSYAQFGRD